MEGMELICFQIITANGRAKSCYIEALQEVKNPNLAEQIATAVIMVINTNIPEQPAINPLAAFFAQLAEQQGKEQEQEPGEKEENGHDRTENAAD